MKTTISLIVFLACLTIHLPGQDIADDVYFKPSDSQNITQRALVKSPKPNYKNGAKEIIYLDSNSNKDLVITNDSIYILGQMNDSIAVAENANEEYESEEGYYLNDFKGSASVLEYAERIRRFHNPKFTVHISDPQYTDIYFLDDNNWNVYVDGSYAWVTPTWTNPFWDNYFWRPYSYSSWYWRNNWYSPYSYYSSWYANPWYGGGYYGNYYNSWGGYYGGYYGGIYGWGNQYYPYYNDYWNYNPYYWGGYSWSGGVTSRNKNYDEANRRKEYYRSTSRSGNLNTTRISGGSYNPTVTRTAVTSNIRGERDVNNSVTVNRPSTGISRGSTNGNSFVRSNDSRGSGITSGINTRTRTMYNTDSRTSERSAFNNTNVRVDGIRSGNTVPAVRSATPAPATRSSVTTNGGSSAVRYGTGTSAIRSYESSPTVISSSSSTPVRSSSSSTSGRSSSSSNYTPSSNSSSSYSNSRSSTPSYSSPSSSSSSSRSSGSSYSGGSSSSRSSSGSSGGRR